MYLGNCTWMGAVSSPQLKPSTWYSRKLFWPKIRSWHHNLPVEKMLLTHSVSGTEGPHVHLLACVQLWEQCLCTHTRVRRGSISHQRQLCCGAAPELQQSCSSRPQVMASAWRDNSLSLSKVTRGRTSAARWKKLCQRHEEKKRAWKMWH